MFQFTIDSLDVLSLYGEEEYNAMLDYLHQNACNDNSAESSAQNS
jgi:hypothetical protein